MNVRCKGADCTKLIQDKVYWFDGVKQGISLPHD